MSPQALERLGARVLDFYPWARSPRLSMLQKLAHLRHHTLTCLIDEKYSV